MAKSEQPPNLPNFNSPDLYKRLGVDCYAAQGEIVEAYRALAQKLHPDKNGHLNARDKERQVENFKNVTQAYQELRNATRRRRYDGYDSAGDPIRDERERVWVAKEAEKKRQKDELEKEQRAAALKRAAEAEAKHVEKEALERAKKAAEERTIQEQEKIAAEKVEREKAEKEAQEKSIQEQVERESAEAKKEKGPSAGDWAEEQLNSSDRGKGKGRGKGKSKKQQRAEEEYRRQNGRNQSPEPPPTTESSSDGAESDSTPVEAEAPPEITPESTPDVEEEPTSAYHGDDDASSRTQEGVNVGGSDTAQNAPPEPQADSQAEADTGPQVNPEDIPDYVKDDLGMDNDSTKKEKHDEAVKSRTLLGKLIDGYKSTLEGASERFTKSKDYLNNRAKEIDAQAQTSKAEKFVRGMGEMYNKLSNREKLGIGIVLGASAVVSGGASIYLPYLFTSLLGAQRAFGMASMYLSQEKILQEAKIMESGQVMSLKERASVSAALSGALFGAAIGKGIEWANESGLVERTREWLGSMLGHSSPEEIPSPKSVGHPPSDSPIKPGGSSAPVAPDRIVPTAKPDIQPAAAAVASGGTVSRPEINYPPLQAPETPLISVEAVKGQGSEYMMKKIWEGLQDLKGQGLNPNTYAEGSDARLLFDTDAKSINDVVHQIATDPKHGFFNTDGTSMRINLDSHMSISHDGTVLIDGNAQAPVGDVTPVVDTEAPATLSTATTPFQAEDPLSAEQRNGLVAEPTNDVAGRVERDISLGEPTEKPAVDLTSAQDAAANSANATPTPDTAPPAPTPVVEHMKEFINVNKVPINPLEGGVFQDSSGATLAYGNDFAMRLDAAQAFAKAHPGTSIWVQAEKPVLSEGVLRPYVLEVKTNWWGGIQILGVDGPPDPSHIGGISPDTFIKRLDK